MRELLYFFRKKKPGAWKTNVVIRGVLYSQDSAFKKNYVLNSKVNLIVSHFHTLKGYLTECNGTTDKRAHYVLEPLG